MMKNSGLIYVFTGNGKGKTSAALGVAMRAVGQGKRVAMVQWYKEQRTENREQRTEIPTWRIGEHRLPELLKKPLFEIYSMGTGFYIKKYYNQSGLAEPDPAPQDRSDYNTFLKVAPLHGGGVAVDTAREIEHKQAAKEAMEMAEKLLKGKMVKMDTMAKMAENSNHFDHSNHSVHLFLLILDEVLNAVNDKLLALPALLVLLELRGATHIILTGRNAPKKLVDIADLVTEMKNVKHPYDAGKKAVLGLDF